MQLNTSKIVLINYGTPKELKAAQNLNSTYKTPFNNFLEILGVLLDSKLTFKNLATNFLKYSITT